MIRAHLAGFSAELVPQMYDHNCGPTALSYIVDRDLCLATEGPPSWNPIDIQRALTEAMPLTHGCGIDLDGMEYFLHTNGIKFSKNVSEDLEEEQATVFDLLDNRVPSMVLWNGWGPHWSVVVGYDLDKWQEWGGGILLADPAIGEKVWYPCLQFRLLWRVPKYGNAQWIAPCVSTTRLWRG